MEIIIPEGVIVSDKKFKIDLIVWKFCMMIGGNVLTQ